MECTKTQIMTHTSTICAISTPPGTGGIAVARISGPQAIEIVNKIWHGKSLLDAQSHTVHLGNIIDPDNNTTLDSGLATIFKAPHSFTGENIVELSIHGSQWIQRELINLLIRQGASIAERGEFTRRAMTNGKLDLAEAEAVADMIATSSRAAQQIAISHLRGHYSKHLETLRNQLLKLSALVELELDFSEEDVEFAQREQLLTLALNIQKQLTRLANSFSTGQALKNGIPIAIIGATNAGKSTLLNRILGEEKAIVSNIHGTTRDLIEDTIEINGKLYRFIDTAGLRNTTNPIETIGIRRSLQAANNADIIIWVIDPENNKETQHIWQQIKNSHAHIITVINKADKQLPTPTLPPHTQQPIHISALTGHNITTLLNEINNATNLKDITPELTVTNARHYQALIAASKSIADVITALHDNLPGDLLAQSLRETATHIASITSPITTPDLLSHIFSTFCIGK